MTCTADNAIFKDMEIRVEGTITINVPPSDRPIMTVGQGLTTTNGLVTVTSGQKIVVRCRVEGGIPQVSQVTIKCDDYSSTVANGSESLHILDVDKDMNRKSCSCAASHVTGCYIRNYTRLALNVQYIPTVIEYTANRENESLEINDGGMVFFHCEAEGNPRPGQLSIRGHRSKESFLLQTITNSPGYTQTGDVTLLMRCQDTDDYTCVAGNHVGDSLAKPISIYVKCEPRFVDFNHGKTDFTLNNAKHFVVKFDIFGYPSPAEFLLSKLRANQTRRTVRRDASVLEVDRNLYIVNYVSIRPGLGSVVLKMFELDDEDSGQYSLTIKNGIGDGIEYRFSITVIADSGYLPTTQGTTNTPSHVTNTPSHVTNTPSHVTNTPPYVTTTHPYVTPTNMCDVCNTAVAVGATVVCGVVLSLLTFVLGVYVGRRRPCQKKTPKEVVRLKPSPDYEDNSNRLAEDYVVLEDIHVQEVRKGQGLKQGGTYYSTVGDQAGPQRNDTYDTKIMTQSRPGQDKIYDTAVPTQTAAEEDDTYYYIPVPAQGGPQRNNTYDTPEQNQGGPQRTKTYDNPEHNQGGPQRKNTYYTVEQNQGGPQRSNTYDPPEQNQGGPQMTNTYDPPEHTKTGPNQNDSDTDTYYSTVPVQEGPKRNKNDQSPVNTKDDMSDMPEYLELH